MATTSEPVLSAKASRGARGAAASEDMPNLDLLRAVAVLLVLLSHLAFFTGRLDLWHMRLPWMGGVGVYFFFVHTCFVLMLSLERQWKGQGALQLFGSFMIRRIFRIYPLSIAVIIPILVFHLPLATYTPGHFVGVSLSTPMIVANFLLLQGSGHSLLGPMWSLPYEMAMYLFLPWIFLFLRSRTSLWGVSALWLISAAAGVAFLVHAGWPQKDFFIVYVPCFLPGVIAWQLRKTRRGHLPAFLWAAVVLLPVPLYLYEQNVFSDYRLKAWVVCLMVGLAIPFFSQISARWVTKPAHLIAKYSYGIYLTHFFCIWFVFSRLHDVLSKTARLGFFAVLVVGLPVLLYHALEEPLIRVGKRVARRFEKMTVRTAASSVPVQAAQEL